MSETMQEHKHSEKNFFSFLWNTLKSVKTTIFILILIACSSIIGTVIPQQGKATAFAENLPPFLLKLFLALDFFDMYHSFWFRFIIAALALNLIACTLNRLPSSIRLVQTPPKPDNENIFKDIPEEQQFSAKLDSEKTFNTIHEVLKKNWDQINTIRKEGIYYLSGVKHRLSVFGPHMVHFSIILIIIGALIGSFFGYRGYVNIPEGEKICCVTVPSRETSTRIHLPFEIRCDSFSIDFYDTGAPKEYRSELTFIRDNKEFLKSPLIVNHPVTIDGITFYQASYGKMGGHITINLGIKDADGKPVFITSRPNVKHKLPDNQGTVEIHSFRPNLGGLGPAASILIQPNNGDYIEFWALKNPEMTKRMLPEAMQKSPKFNEKIFPPYSFSIESIEERFYTGIQVSKDPGVPVVWTAFFIMSLGFIIIVFMPYRRLFVRISDNEGGSVISVAGRSSQRNINMHNELTKIADQFNQKTI